MRIHSVTIANFKGINAEQVIDIRPITLFVGPNSSGKSSVIHALCALAQTAKSQNEKRPLVLDGESALVHLGRFIEAVHSRSYSGSIRLGVDIGVIPMPPTKAEQERRVRASCKFSFLSTKKTQDIYISQGEIVAGEQFYQIKQQKGSGYRISRNGWHKPIDGSFANGFMLDFGSLFIHCHQIKFKPEEIYDLMFTQQAIDYSLKSIRYLGPFRSPPLRRYQTMGSMPVDVGCQGESAFTLLANEVLKTRSRPHYREISKWMQIVGIGDRIVISRLGKSDLMDIKIGQGAGIEFPLADLGYGISQVLPVLIQCSFAEPNSTLLFEQPEIHLHPNAARRLTEIFATVATEKKVNILVETHSERLIGEAQRLIRDKMLDPNDVVIYDVRRKGGCTHFSKAVPDNEGELFKDDQPWDWKAGFCE